MPIPQVTDRIKEAPAVVLRAVFAGIGQLLMAVDKIRAQMEQATPPAEADQQAPNGTQPPIGAQPPRRPEETGNVAVLRDGTAATTATHPAAPPAAAGTRTAPAATPAASEPGAAPAAQTAAEATTAVTAEPAAPPKPTAAPKPTSAPKPTPAPKPTAASKPAAAPEPAAAPKPTAAPNPAAAPKPAAAPGPTAAPKAAAQAPPIPGYDDLSIASLRARLRGLDADGVRALLAYEKANARRDDVMTMFERRISKLEDEAG